MPLYPSGMLRLKEWMRSPSASTPSAPANIIDNGTFDSASGWTVTGPGSITGGVAQGDVGGATTFSRNANTAVTPGGYYKVTLDFIQTAGSSVSVAVGGGDATTFVTSGSGTYSTYVIAGATQDVSVIINSTDAIDNLIVTPVTATAGADIVQNGSFADATNWGTQSGWSISGGTANATSAASNRSLINTPSTAPVIGTRYLATFTITSWAAGAVFPNVGAAGGTAKSAPGTYSQLLQAVTTTSPAIKTSGTTTLSVDNISVVPVTFSA